MDTKGDEIWRVVNFADARYLVSNRGKIMNSITNKILKPNDVHHGYLQVTLCFNNYRRSYLVHRLVAFSFIDNPRNLQQLNHLDRDKANNNDWNLEWVTPSENVQHSYDSGREMPSKKGRKYRVLDDIQIKAIKASKGHIPILRMAAYFMVNPSTIRNAIAA